MDDFKFRLNRYTFVRRLPEYFYLENQVSHIHAKLPIAEFEWLDTDSADATYSFVSLYGDSPNSSKAYATLLQMHEAWLIDIDGRATPAERKFSYANKRDLERRFDDFPPIGINPTDEKPYLRNLQIELTDACNERCIHCYLPNAKKDKCKALSKEQVFDILQQYRAMQGLKVVFSGGEILLHPHIFDILEECKRLGLMILLQSNLLSLTERDLVRLKDLEVFNIQVSLYSTDANIHEAITQRKGSFAKTKRNLELLVRNDIPAMISCPVMDVNFPTVRDLHRYARLTGLDIYFDFMMMAGCDGCRDNLSSRLNLKQVKEALTFYLEANPLYSRAIAMSATLDDALSKRYARRRTMCDILSASICIDSDGSIYPCPGWNGLKLGNISSTSLADAWTSDLANKLRAITIHDYIKCKNCDKHNFCDMCAVYNYNENGNVFDVCTRFCEMAQLLRECVVEKFRDTH